jgi:hypothetical protein
MQRLLTFADRGMGFAKPWLARLLVRLESRFESIHNLARKRNAFTWKLISANDIDTETKVTSKQDFTLRKNNNKSKPEYKISHKTKTKTARHTR